LLNETELPSEISIIKAYDNHVYVGTKDGFIRKYNNQFVEEFAVKTPEVEHFYFFT
jgi:hypothetical protein